MPSPIHGIDHAVIVVRDLAAAAATYERLGFTLTPRGNHSTGSTNHCFMLGRDYLELLALPVKSVSPWQQYFADFVAAGEGLGGIALASFDAIKARTHLQMAGFQPTDIAHLAREVEDPRAGIKGLARFNLVQTNPKTTPGAQFFVCQQLTRELVWAPAYQEHPNGAFEIAAISVVTDNVAKTAETYCKLFGNWPERIDEGMLVRTCLAPLAVSTAAALQKRLSGLQLGKRTGTHVGALWLRVRDRARVEQVLRQAEVAYVRLSDGSIGVHANDAHGIAIVFGE